MERLFPFKKKTIRERDACVKGDARDKNKENTCFLFAKGYGITKGGATNVW